MALNVSDPNTHQFPLEVFGGLVTNINPTALPLGASPDTADTAFLMGGVSQRPAFRKIFASPLGHSTITYGKSYVDPKGVIRNLYLDSLGNLWMENITTSAVPVIIGTTTPGSYAKSITAFGREYIAISDGIHGSDVALQYDGTKLERVTQDGPGTPPTVTSLIIPAVQMLGGTAPPTLTVAQIDPDQKTSPTGFFTTLNIYYVVPAAQLPNPGDNITITGTTYDGTYPVLSVGGFDGAITVSALNPFTAVPYSGSGIITIGSGTPALTMQRQSNVVTVFTATPHNLQVGYRAQITGVRAASVGGGIASITIKNEDFPGQATVTTVSPHGLVPGLFVSLQGILGSAIGGGVVSIDRAGGITTVTTASAHGLNPGSNVTIAGNTDASLNTSPTVATVPSPTTFTFFQPNAADTTGTGGTLTIDWPIPDTPTPTYYEVVTAPTATTFLVQVYYSDGAWTSGTVLYAWDGTFFVQSIPTPTTFTYQQYGPDDEATDAGTVTPAGQLAPGQKQCRVSFLTDQGYLTAPSPPVTFVANGGQYASVTNIPIGPSNVVARVLQFTGANGAYFFYIPATPQINGQIVGTSTQINDNSTTSAILDFSDPTLFAALGTSIQGNNLANQITIDGALGFALYGSRIFTYGQRNKVINLLNMGFDGGFIAAHPDVPTGWTRNPASTGGNLANGHYGQAWQIAITPGGTFCGLLTQSFFEDSSGAPIGRGNTHYKLRAWIKSSAPSGDAGFFAAISSFDSSFQAFAELTNITTAGSWMEADFTVPTSDLIPADMILSIYATALTSSVTLTVDEISIVYADTPYLTGMFASYVENPEAFDAVSGVIGPEDDTHPVMELGIVRSRLFMLTQDPSGRLHETSQGIGEPAGWVVDETAANCGAISAFSMTRSQSDDTSAAGGEEWFAWYSSTGPRIFGGESPEKIAQEIQRPSGPAFPGAPEDLGALNPAARLTVWGLNDPAQKLMWFGIPTGTATAPDKIYCLNYLDMDSASAIAGAAPVRQALSGKLVAKDASRKWAPWRRPMNGAALMLRGEGDQQPVFFGGNGVKPGAGGFGNVYALGSFMNTDDDYGGFLPYYVTAQFPTNEQQMLVGSAMVLLAYLGWFCSGIGQQTMEVFTGNLLTAWPLNAVYALVSNPTFDWEWSGGQPQAQGFFFKLSISPATGTDVAFNWTKLAVALKKCGRMTVRGAGQ